MARKEWDWDEFVLNHESKAPINAPGYRRELKGSRVTLFGTGVSLGAQEIAKLSIATEKAAQKSLIKVANTYKGLIKNAIAGSGHLGTFKAVVDTGATFESVYVLLPPSLSAQKAVRNSPEKDQRLASTAGSFRDFKKTRRVARGLNKKVQGNSSWIDTEASDKTNVGRIKKDHYRNFTSQSVRWSDVPYNPPSTVARKNLYVGIGVGTPYSIFPHEGGGSGANEDPRRFFSPYIEEMQGVFAEVFKNTLEGDLSG